MMIKLVSFAAAIFALIAPQPADAQRFDRPYSQHGRYVVKSMPAPGNQIVCYARTETGLAKNRSFHMNFVFDGKDWTAEFPYQPGRPVSGEYRLDDRTGTYRTDPMGNGYNATRLNNRFIKAFSRAETFALKIPNVGNPVMSTRGAARALEDVRACVRNKGIPPQAATSAQPPRPPVLSRLGGEPASWGGFTVIGTGQTSIEAIFDRVRGWQVLAAKANGRHAYCVATFQQDGFDVRLGSDGLKWQLAVPIQTRKDWSGSIEIDGAARKIAGTSVRGWTVALLNQRDLNGLKEGRFARVSAGRSQYNFPLRGSAAAISKIEDCQRRRAGDHVAAAPQPIKPAPELATPRAPKDEPPPRDWRSNASRSTANQ